MYKPERIRQINGLGAVVETYLTIDELAGYLKLAEQTVRRWVLNREIPFHKIHKVIRFRVSEIEKWIDGGGVNNTSTENDGIEGGLFGEDEGLENEGLGAAETGGEV